MLYGAATQLAEESHCGDGTYEFWCRTPSSIPQSEYYNVLLVGRRGVDEKRQRDADFGGVRMHFRKRSPSDVFGFRTTSMTAEGDSVHL